MPNDLRKAIQNDLGFLFREHGASFVDREAGRYASKLAIVDADAIRFRVGRDRGEYSIEIAPVFAPTEWEDLVLVLSSLGLGDTQSVSKALFGSGLDSLVGAGEMLRLHYPQLREAYSVEQYNKTVERLDALRNVVQREGWARIRRDSKLPPFLGPDWNR